MLFCKIDFLNNVVSKRHAQALQQILMSPFSLHTKAYFLPVVYTTYTIADVD